MQYVRTPKLADQVTTEPSYESWWYEEKVGFYFHSYCFYLFTLSLMATHELVDRGRGIGGTSHLTLTITYRIGVVSKFLWDSLWDCLFIFNLIEFVHKLTKYQTWVSVQYWPWPRRVRLDRIVPVSTEIVNPDCRGRFNSLVISYFMDFRKSF